jgi:hypothetical protein
MFFYFLWSHGTVAIPPIGLFLKIYSIVLYYLAYIPTTATPRSALLFNFMRKCILSIFVYSGSVLTTECPYICGTCWRRIWGHKACFESEIRQPLRIRLEMRPINRTTDPYSIQTKKQLSFSKVWLVRRGRYNHETPGLGVTMFKWVLWE